MDLDRNKIAFITCVNDEDMYNECLLYLQSLHVPDGMSVEYIPVRGASSMCSGYNAGARRTNARYKVYLHQDVLVVNKNLIQDLLSIFRDEEIALVGMIGSRVPACGGTDCVPMAGFCITVNPRAWWTLTAWNRTGIILR